jgi:hypothetical protein
MAIPSILNPVISTTATLAVAFILAGSAPADAQTRRTTVAPSASQLQTMKRERAPRRTAEPQRTGFGPGTVRDHRKPKPQLCIPSILAPSGQQCF